MTYEEVLKQLEDYHYALSTESRLIRTGQKSDPQLAAIQRKYADLFAKDRIIEVREAIGTTMDAKARERMERVLFALIEGFVSNQEMPIEEQILTEQGRASANVDGERVGYFEFAGRVAREEDPAKREKLRAAYVDLVAQNNPKYLDLQHATRQSLSSFGFATPREYAETKKRVRYDDLLKKTIPILEETTGLYRRVMSDVMRKAYGKELGEIETAHVAHWRAGHEFERHFPANQLLPLCKGALATIGLDLDAVPQIAVDAEDRPRKNPRACCYPARVPEEVHLIIKPKGGFDDYRAFMHEAGHALHFAHTDAALPYEWREMSRSHALTEIFSFTFEHLTENPLWLEHALKIPHAAAERIAAWALLGNLFMLRRYIAKFTYELAFDEKPYDDRRNKALYAETLRELTGVRYEPDMYLEDMDGLFYSADYLRAWLASAQLEEHLTRKFSDRWFLKRESGAFLKEIYAKGVSWENEELVQSLGMTAWEPLPLIRKFDGVSKLLR